MRLRGASIALQLGGSIPSTAAGQRGFGALVDASELDLSVMGSMDPGGGASGEPGSGESSGETGESAEFAEAAESGDTSESNSAEMSSLEAATSEEEAATSAEFAAGPSFEPLASAEPDDGNERRKYWLSYGAGSLALLATFVLLFAALRRAGKR